MLRRLFVGLGSGVGLCVGPVYLAEIAPPKISGNVGELEVSLLSTDEILSFLKGVLTQLGIVLGIMITQAMGLRLASPTEWRIVLFCSFALSAAQVLLSMLVVESPSWLAGNGQLDEKKAVAKRLWGSDGNHPKHLLVPGQRNEYASLDQLEARREDTPVSVVTVPQLLVAPELRKPLAIISLAMVSQQLSGRSPLGSLL